MTSMGTLTGVQERGFLLTKNRYGVAVCWDNIDKKGMDLDLQAVIVDQFGIIVDAVYYNNLVALGGAVGHTGDEQQGDSGALYDEAIWVVLPKLPAQVALIIFVVASYSVGFLEEAENAKVVVLQNTIGGRVCEFRLRKGGDSEIVLVMKRGQNDAWIIKEGPRSKTPSAGSHFLDLLEPELGDVIRAEIPGAPARQKVTFLMDKGAVSDLPLSSSLKRLAVGIGGSVRRGQHSVDTDISAVFLNKALEVCGAVDHRHKSKYGICHSGDSLAGGNRLDDEALTIDLQQIPRKVQQIFFVLTVKKGTFAQVQKLYARVVDQSCAELIRYSIGGSEEESGLIIGRLFRLQTTRWGFQALGTFCHGPTWRKALPELEQLAAERPDHMEVASPELKRRLSQQRRQRFIRAFDRCEEEEGSSSLAEDCSESDVSQSEVEDSSCSDAESDARVFDAAPLQRQRDQQRPQFDQQGSSKLEDQPVVARGKSTASGELSPLAAVPRPKSKSKLLKKPLFVRAMTPWSFIPDVPAEGRLRARVPTMQSLYHLDDALPVEDEAVDPPTRRCCCGQKAEGKSSLAWTCLGL